MDVHWQVQEAKQRFSEVLRRAKTEGPQIVTKHGRDVAVVVDIDEYHRLTAPPMDFREFLLSIPKGDDGAFDVERTRDPEREIDFSDL
jgi:antitoxin Phd